MNRTARQVLIAALVVSAAMIVMGSILLATVVTRAPSSAVPVTLAVLFLVAGNALGIASIVLYLYRVGQSRNLAQMRRLEKLVHETRAKASRHEYIQEQALSRIEAAALETRSTTAGIAWYGSLISSRGNTPVEEGSTPSILFVTSNGGGMGHIARCCALMRHGSEHLSGRILSLSSAATLVADSGYDVGHFPSQSTFKRGEARWHRQFARRLLTEIKNANAAAVVFDGTWIYEGVREAAEYADIPLVWVRRGLWKPDIDRTQVEQSNSHATVVLTPRDVAENEYSPGSLPSDFWCDPISLAPRTRLGRSQALTRLKLDPDLEYVLVQLSGGNDSGDATQAAVDAVRRCSQAIPVVVDSPLYRGRPVEGAVTIGRRFPLVDYAAAWEFTITGAGYNSVHENLHTITPGIYIPSVSTITDDQARRAAAVTDIDGGLVAESAEDIVAAVERMRDGLVRQEMRSSLRRLALRNGADDAAALISGVVASKEGTAWI